MKELMLYVLSNYNNSLNEPFKDHPMASAVKESLPAAIEAVIIDKERYKIEGSPGKGRWTFLPWVAIFDVLVTTSAQSGYYPVYLFREDMSGVYLSLNQGVTAVKADYKKEAAAVLKIRAEDYRAKLGNLKSGFTLEDIHTNSSVDNGKLYDAGSIVAKYYPKENIPADSVLTQDILEILRLYDMLCYNDGIPTSEEKESDDLNDYADYEDRKKVRLHRRVERNATLARKVKKIQGYRCKACGLTFELTYGPIGKDFIEAHHLIPLGSLNVERILLDARKDFTVLCSNCHRMIHKLKDPSNLEELIKIIKGHKLDTDET
jgi:5-methylcytosine-specific restriction protein A